MELHKILQEMEEHVANASRIPLTGKVMVDGDMILEFIDKIHASLPYELKQAQQILEQRDVIVEGALSQSKRIEVEAREQASHLTTETEVYREAVRCSEALFAEAKRDTAEMRREALMYSDDIFHQLEVNLEKLIFSIKKNREGLRNYPLNASSSDDKR